MSIGNPCAARTGNRVGLAARGYCDCLAQPRRLRAKVDADFAIKLIRAVRGMGYVLDAPEPPRSASPR